MHVREPPHPQLAGENVPKLHAPKATWSLKSPGDAKGQFAWRRCSWYLTDEGIQYLRDYRPLPPEIVPATLLIAGPRLAGQGPNVLGLSDLQDSQEGSWQRHPQAERAGDSEAQHPGGEAASGGAQAEVRAPGAAVGPGNACL